MCAPIYDINRFREALGQLRPDVTAPPPLNSQRDHDDPLAHARAWGRTRNRGISAATSKVEGGEVAMRAAAYGVNIFTSAAAEISTVPVLFSPSTRI